MNKAALIASILCVIWIGSPVSPTESGTSGPRASLAVLHDESKDALVKPVQGGSGEPRESGPQPSSSAALGSHVGRIGVREQSSGYGEFYEVTSGRTFVPQGMNYMRIAYPPSTMFDPGQFNPVEIESALKDMKRNGYNVVRVFLNQNKIGGQLATPGLDPAYMNNVLTLLRLAKAYDSRVVIALAWLPANYSSLVGQIPASVGIDGVNAYFMYQPSIDAFKSYWSDIVRYLKRSDDALLATVLSFEIWNEPCFSATEKPFSLTSGFVTTAEGGTYDLSDPDSRQRAADHSATYWANQISAAIKAVYPHALTTAGVFTPYQVGLPSYNGVPAFFARPVPLRVTALAASSFDYIDIHSYAMGASYDMAKDLNSAELSRIPKTKPLLMGEFGAFKFVYPDLADAVTALRGHRRESCQFAFNGWLLWTRDSHEQPDIWNALDGEGAINRALAPTGNPFPCLGIKPTGR
jgi:Cellulase (glycosyl hydrolase family 5)